MNNSVPQKINFLKNNFQYITKDQRKNYLSSLYLKKLHQRQHKKQYAKK